MSKAIDRVSRMLALLTYLRTKPDGVEIEKAGIALGMPAAQVLTDARTLLNWCSLPGQGVDDFIDIEFTDSSVRLINGQGLERPLRLTAEEALAISVAARSLASIPGIASPEVLESTIEALEAAAIPGWTAATTSVGTRKAGELEARAMAHATAALDGGRAMHIRYLAPVKDEISERTIDPIAIRRYRESHYLLAWCRKAEAVRSFRLDRIIASSVLEEASQPSEAEIPEDYEPVPSATELPTTTIVLSRARRWQADYVPHVRREEAGDGSLRLEIAVSDDPWLARLFMAGGGNLRLENRQDLEEICAQRARVALAHYGG